MQGAVDEQPRGHALVLASDEPIAPRLSYYIRVGIAEQLPKKRVLINCVNRFDESGEVLGHVCLSQTQAGDDSSA